MDSRKAIDAPAIGLMLILCMIWGFQGVAIKVTAPDIAPLMQMALRSGIAAALVGLLMLAQRERINLADQTWRPGLVVGFLFALEFLSVGEGLRYTSASHLVVFIYTAPVFAALGLHWRLPAERLQPIQWAGIGLAFAGIGVAFLRHAPQVDQAAQLTVLWGDCLGVLGGLAWGATTVVVRCSSLSNASASLTLLYQLVGGFVLLMAAAVGLGQTGFNPTALAWGSLLFQAIVVSFITFLAWFWMLGQYQASRLGVLSFMTPLFGVAFGVGLLQETLEPTFMAGALLTLSGIVLVNGYDWLQQALNQGVSSGDGARNRP